MVLLVRLYAHYTAFHSCINSLKQYHPVIMNVIASSDIEEKYILRLDNASGLKIEQ